MKILSLLKSKSFWKNSAYAILFYILFFIVIVIGLRIYTSHGNSYPVPDFKGLDLERCAQIAKTKNLRLNIVDSTYVSYLPKGSVIDQHPIAGVNVKKNRTIFLTINAFSQVKVEMPNVVGVSFRQGKSIIESMGLKVGKLIYKPDFAKNNILEQKYNGKPIETGTKIEKGQYVDLVLGNGLGRSTSLLPNLYKKTYSKAVDEINDDFFNVGKVYFDESVLTYNDSLNAMVLTQRPKYRKKARAVMGSTIDIWLSIDAEKFHISDSLKQLNN